VMQHGCIEQLDTPQNLYNNPTSLDVAEFLQIGPVVPGALHCGTFTPQARPCVPPLHGIEIAARGVQIPADGPARLLIPHRAVQAEAGVGPAVNVRVERCWFAGEHYDLEGAWLEGQPLLRWRSARAHAVGSATQVRLDTDALRLYHADTGRLLP
jgi:ABC-type Fe3+/spermidine/putrescine transport system ATPase subunit